MRRDMTPQFQGFEGLVVKDALSMYEPGKRHWLMVKKDYLGESSMADSAQEEKANLRRKKAKRANITTFKSKEEVVMEEPSTKRLKLEEEKETEVK